MFTFKKKLYDVLFSSFFKGDFEVPFAHQGVGRFFCAYFSEVNYMIELISFDAMSFALLVPALLSKRRLLFC